MRASVFVGSSLDGFIDRPNGAFDFLPARGGEEHGYQDFIASMGALVIVATRSFPSGLVQREYLLSSSG